MVEQMKCIIDQFNLHTTLLKNVVKDFTEADSEKQIEKANHVKWLMGHIVSSRYYIAGLIGLKEQDPYADFFNSSINSEVKYPSVKAIMANWESLSQKMIECMKNMTPADWDAKANFAFPISDGTLKSSINFFAHHEAYTIGQIGYIRRIVGLEGMKYN